MPLLPWRCPCWRGGLPAYGAVSAHRRPFSRSSLSYARPRSHEPSRRKEKSRAASPSSKKRASPPRPSGKQGVFHSRPHGGSQRSSPSSSPPSPPSAMEVGGVRGAATSLRTSCSTEEKERGLLRYFSCGRCLYDTVPLQSASFALQRASCTQAQRVPLVTLFPAPSPSELRPSLSASAAACPTAESPGPIGVQPPVSHPVGKSVATAEGPTQVAPSTASSPLSRVLSSNLFSKYELQERHHSDWLQFRLLSARFSSAFDSNKFFGAAEKPLRDVCADMAEIWDTTCTAWEEAMQARNGATGSGAAGLPKRHSACFLVCYVQTQQKAAVGVSMQRIAAQVCELARANYAPQLFRVVPVFIGVRAQMTLCMDATACSFLAADVAATVGAQTTETTVYATGGLYTVAETVQCITHLDPHAFDPRGSSDALPHVASSRGAPELLCTLEPQVFLLSDSWLHVRSVADLYGDDSSMSNSASDNRAASAAASPASEQARNLHAHGARSFVPESTRRNVHVIPAVVADRLSRKEERAIARYIWCDMQRRVSGWRAAATLQPLHPSSLAKPL